MITKATRDECNGNFESPDDDEHGDDERDGRRGRDDGDADGVGGERDRRRQHSITASVNNPVTGSPLVITLTGGTTITIPVGSSSASSAAVVGARGRRVHPGNWT